MPISRYRNDVPIRGSQLKASARAVQRIRREIRRGNIDFRTITLKESTRLDQIAGESYGSGQYWWVIAAASDIGWAWQVPAGTRVRIPTDLSQVMGIV